MTESDATLILIFALLVVVVIAQWVMLLSIRAQRKSYKESAEFYYNLYSDAMKKLQQSSDALDKVIDAVSKVERSVYKAAALANRTKLKKED